MYTDRAGFVMYEYTFTKLRIQFPFIAFEIGILNCLNVCLA